VYGRRGLPAKAFASSQYRARVVLIEVHHIEYTLQNVIERFITFAQTCPRGHFDVFVAFNAINRDVSINVIGSINDTRWRRLEAHVQTPLSPAALAYMIIGIK
jgi:hypothetical protein